MKTAITTLGAALLLGGCGLSGGIDPAAVCADQARENGPDFRVVASFSTTVGTVRDLMPRAVPPRWPELPAESPAAVCYLDGPVPQAPPDGRPFDRAIIAVAGEHAELIIAGYRDELHVEAP